MVDVTVLSTDLQAAFARLRTNWKQLYDGAPEPGAKREQMLNEVDADLGTVEAAARVSADARQYILVAFRVRLGEWAVDGRSIPPELAEAAEGVRSGLEMRLRTLRQMESGDDILPDSGRDVRRSAARDTCFFYKLRRLLGADGAGDEKSNGDPQKIDLARLSQCYDGRRKLVREEIAVPSPAVEAIEFLIRLGASG